MASIPSRPTFRAVLLYIFVIVGQVTFGIYIASQTDPPPLFIFIYALGFLWLIGWWLSQDSRKHGFSWFADLGLFLYIAWPILVPYYLFKTRGLRGVLFIVSFVAVYIASLVIGVTLYVAINPTAFQ